MSSVKVDQCYRSAITEFILCLELVDCWYVSYNWSPNVMYFCTIILVEWCYCVVASLLDVDSLDQLSLLYVWLVC